MSEKVTKISDSDFDALVINPKRTAAVLFTAEWCGPCRMAKPIMATAAEKYSQRASFFEVNIDDNQTTAMKYDVRSLPTIITFTSGELYARQVGGITRDKINGMIENALA